MKKLATVFAAVGLMLVLAAGAQASITVDVSLEPATGTVVDVGQTFDLDLWLRSSDASTLVMTDIDLLLKWDPAYVSFAGSASTADGDYDWTTAMCHPSGMFCTPMYYGEGSFGENQTYTDGDARIHLGTMYAPLHGMSYPQTDLKALTLTFTALDYTDSTVIAPSLGVPGEPPTPGDPYCIVEADTGVHIGGSVSGSDVTIIPEPASIIIWSLIGGLSWLGLSVWRRRHGSGPAGRTPWPEENRIAIRRIIDGE